MRRVDEDVARLDVGVHHALLMRVADRVAHAAEQGQPCSEIQVPLFDMLVDRQAAHQLHHDVGLTVRRGAAVVQPGDVGMVQAREDFAFLGETLCRRAGKQPAMYQLDGDRLAETALDTLGAVYRAHAPLPDRLGDAVDAYTVGQDPGGHGWRGRGRGLFCRGRFRSLHDRGAHQVGIPLCGEQAFHPAQQRGIIGAHGP